MDSIEVAAVPLKSGSLPGPYPGSPPQAMSFPVVIRIPNVPVPKTLSELMHCHFHRPFRQTRLCPFHRATRRPHLRRSGWMRLISCKRA